ncbi:hypothetical protein SAMN04515671_4147 [Nakamurella panacisegetis]|uniref:DUF305 domain-containing protein n=2 Tax=Nakamurella panacisegetis TaxID=1090615 RepID=A0A1H0SKH0_9ACTN|nr:hypothetical protein SAMN04515671_4147 [Nakamurella panacisegetis]
MLGAGTAALLATAGCNPFSTPTRVTRTVTASAAPAVDPMLTLTAITRLHVVRLANVIAANKPVAARLTPLLKDRQVHLAQLIAEVSRTSPQAGASEKAKPTSDPTLAVPTGASPVLLAAMKSDAATAQTAFIDAFSLASRYRAALFGSIAACLASHQEALS